MTLRARVRSLFPALVQVASPLTLLKSGTVYTFGLSVTALRNSLDSVYVVGTSGQYPASSTNDNAVAGNVGEYVESVVPIGSAVSLVSGFPKDVTTISLSAGDWDIDTVCQFFPANTTQFQSLAVSISATANTQDTTPGRYNNVPQGSITSNGSSTYTSLLPNYRLSLSATTTFHMIAQASFSVSTMTAFGIIRARRAR